MAFKTNVDAAFDSRDGNWLGRLLQEERIRLEKCMALEGVVLSSELRSAKSNTRDAEANVVYVRSKLAELLAKEK